MYLVLHTVKPLGERSILDSKPPGIYKEWKSISYFPYGRHHNYLAGSKMLFQGLNSSYFPKPGDICHEVVFTLWANRKANNRNISSKTTHLRYLFTSFWKFIDGWNAPRSAEASPIWSCKFFRGNLWTIFEIFTDFRSWRIG